MFTKNLIYSIILSMSLSVTGCGSDDPESKDNQTDNQPVAKGDVLIVEEDSTSGEANRVNVSENDDLGMNGGGDDNYAKATNPLHGNITEISDGVFEYIPNYNYDGEDSFLYTINDSKGNEAVAKVDIIVNPYIPTKEDFNNIDPDLPSFVSIDNTTPLDKKWTKVEAMSDEFNTWDLNKWFKSTWNYGVPVYMSASMDNSGVSDGNLWIKATLNENNPEQRWFQSARIHSKAKINYPMYTEARIKTAHISAFNTFWLNNGDASNRDEIDIIENNSKPSCGCRDKFPTIMNSQYFHADSKLTPVVIRNSSNYNNTDLSEANPLKGVPWNMEYHTVGVWWKDSKNIQFYLDGEPAGNVVVGNHESGDDYPNRLFTRDLEIIFDLWTKDEDWLGGLPAKADLNDNTINTMKIDWVRTWKLEDI
ncbi:family 16 glycosylhydrolase [Aquimarina sp. ERC-38]|uniref:Ig-like domain-containing protein n=1 Tax=Aquimarina sp. ERC-38 TaxID=2949996 RepID=UPI00224709AF|nr:Ig-like domain-containing protein [Aquimarina sp. ERC-38]UZO82602.1 family 16 glycosylhydrolase [Aquimarina sp. ERC-38]